MNSSSVNTIKGSAGRRLVGVGVPTKHARRPRGLKAVWIFGNGLENFRGRSEIGVAI